MLDVQHPPSYGLNSRIGGSLPDPGTELLTDDSNVWLINSNIRYTNVTKACLVFMEFSVNFSRTTFLFSPHP